MTSPMMCIALLFLSRGVPLSSIRSQQDQGDQCIEVDSLGFDQMMMSNSSTLLRQSRESSPLPQWLIGLKAGFDSLAGSAKKISASVETTIMELKIQHWLKAIQANIETAKALAAQVQELQAMGFNDERWENAHIEIQNALKANGAFRELQEPLAISKEKKQAAKADLQQAMKKARAAKNNIDNNMQLTNKEVESITKDDPLDEFAAAFFAERAKHEETEKFIMQELIKIKEGLQQSIIKAGGDAAADQELYVELEMETAELNLKLSQLYFEVKIMFDNCRMHIMNVGLHDKFAIDKDGKIKADGEDAEVWTDIQHYLQDFDPEIVKGFGQ